MTAIIVPNGQVNGNHVEEHEEVQHNAQNENEEGQNDARNEQQITLRRNGDEAEVVVPLPFEQAQPGERTVYINLNRERNDIQIRVVRRRRHRRNFERE